MYDVLPFCVFVLCVFFFSFLNLYQKKNNLKHNLTGAKHHYISSKKKGKKRWAPVLEVWLGLLVGGGEEYTMR